MSIERKPQVTKRFPVRAEDITPEDIAHLGETLTNEEVLWVMQCTLRCTGCGHRMIFHGGGARAYCNVTRCYCGMIR